MKPIILHLTNLQHGANFVRVGLPCSQGEVSNCNELTVTDPEGVQISSFIRPAAIWPDGSIKWCLAKISLANIHTPDLKVSITKDASPASLPVLVDSSDNSNGIVIRSGSATFEFAKNTVFPSVTVNNATVWHASASYPLLTTTDGIHCDFEINNISIDEQDGISCKLTIAGTYQPKPNQCLNAKFIFEVLPGAQLSLVCELHNAQRAIHPGGIWDLGDAGSFQFQDFSIVMQKQSDSVSRLKPVPEAEWIHTVQPTVLFQASSGGDHWDCAVHKNSEGEVCNKFRGYQLRENNQPLQSGNRSNPILSVTTKENCGWTVQTQNFWQNFPKSIDIGTNEVQLRLFPYHHGDAYELQGGERKTHHALFNFLTPDQSPDKITATTPLARVDSSAYKNAGVFSNFNDHTQNDLYDNLINAANDKDTGFFRKREQLDEYGWRNFGDIYADHEAAYHKDDSPYISHYNNQYDAVFGFIRQHALTGNTDWQILMTDLARHVMDIDIYRTDKDRAEYNNGLFWHTNHYVQAHTGTHRTYSSGQLDNDGNPPTGGGPGPEHCYSTGLAYYYYMTGDEEAKKTVLGLGDWITNYHEGTGTLLEAAQRTLRQDTADFIKTCKGAKIFKYRYPMDRGTGNYMRTLLDCFDLTADLKYLQQVENIIKNTAGPNDDIEARNLDDIEYNWWYVVYLQELIRYLDLKRTLDQRDDDFYHARATLLYYTKWMLSNDKPFLESADRLLYPNATWIAQESRKIHVFYAAYKYALNNRAEYLARARFYRDYVANKLSASDTQHYSRIQILLMQNHGPSAFIDIDSLPYPGMQEVTISDNKGCFHTPSTHLKNIANTWISCLSNFRISNELRWIKTRTS